MSSSRGDGAGTQRARRPHRGAARLAHVAGEHKHREVGGQRPARARSERRAVGGGARRLLEHDERDARLGGLVQLGFIAADPNHPREIVEQAKYLQKAFDLGASSPGLPAPTGSVAEVAQHIATAELEVEQLRQRLAAANQELETFTTTTQQTPLASTSAFGNPLAATKFGSKLKSSTAATATRRWKPGRSR